MTDPCFPAQIAEITNPDNGTIYWIEAAYAAKQHGLWDDFRTDYGTTASFGGVDAGEFLDVFSASADELLQWCRDGRITDAKTLTGMLWLQNLRSGAWSLDWASV